MKQMETPDQLLQQWAAQPAATIDIRLLRTDPALQPRATACVSFARLGAVEAASADHIRCMAVQLKATAADPEPVLVAKLPEGHFIVDGHHRLAACKQAGRTAIPARVLEVERRAAVLASKLVNYGGEKLRLHSDQHADAAWQTITDMTDRGRRKLPKGTSQRSLEARFGVSLGTINRMIERLGHRVIDPSAYDTDHLDPGTGWPRWRHARNLAYGTDRYHLPADDRRRKAAAGLARKIAEFYDREGRDGLSLAITMLREHGIDDASLGDLEDLSGVIEGDDGKPDY